MRDRAELQEAVGERYRIVESSRLGERDAISAAITPDGQRVSIRRITGDRTTLETFANDARVVAMRQHLAVQTLRECFFVDAPAAALLLVHDLPAGRSLGALIDEGIAVPESEIHRIASFVLETLVHLRGSHPAMSHGDLGLGTILREDNGRLVLLACGSHANASEKGDLADLSRALRTLSHRQSVSAPMRAWIERLPTSASALAALVDLRRTFRTENRRGLSAGTIAAFVALPLIIGGVGVAGLLMYRARHRAASVASIESKSVTRLPGRMFGPAALLKFDHAFEADDDIRTSIALSPDGSRLATASRGAAKVWDTNDDHVVRSLEKGGLDCLAFSPDGKVLAKGDGNVVTVVDVGDGHETRRITTAHASPGACEFSVDGKSLYTVGKEGSTNGWDVATGKASFNTPYEAQILSVAVSSRGMIAVGSRNGVVRLLAPTGKVLSETPAHAKGVGAVTFSRDGSLLATAGDDRVAKGFTVTPEGKLVERYRVEQYDEAWDVRFTPDGASLVVAGKDGFLRVVGATDGMPRTYTRLGKSAGPLQITPDGSGVFVLNAHTVNRFRFSRRGLGTVVPAATVASPATPTSSDQAAFDQLMRMMMSWPEVSLDKVRPKLEEASAKYPRSPLPVIARAQYTLKLAYVDGNKYDKKLANEAHGLLVEAATRGPRSAAWYSVSAWVLRALDDRAGAREAVKSARALDAKEPYAALADAKLDLDDKRYGSASAKIRDLLSSPQSREVIDFAYDIEASAYAGLGDLDAAEKVYVSRIEASPTSAWAHGNFAAFLLWDVGEANRAVDEARAALKIMDYGNGRRALASALAERGADKLWGGDDAGAFADLEESIRLEPTARAHYARAAYWRAKAFDKRDKWLLPKARIDLAACEKLAPGDLMTARALTELDSVETHLAH